LAGGGLQIGAGGRIAPEQGEYVAAEDIEVLFLGSQPNRLREVLEHGLGGSRFHEAHLATVLPGLPQTGGSAAVLHPVAGSLYRSPLMPPTACLVENGGGIWKWAPTRAPDKMEICRRNQE
jgi:hypothetical protein